MFSKERVVDLLLKYDPMEIYFADVNNADVYDQEAADIARDLPKCRSEEDCLSLVYGVFRRYFGTHARGPEKYLDIAAALWGDLWASPKSDPAQ